MCCAKSPTATLGTLTRRWWMVVSLATSRNPHGRLERRVRHGAGRLLLHGELVRLFHLCKDRRPTTTMLSMLLATMNRSRTASGPTRS